MSLTKNSEKTLNLEISIEEMSEQQIRLIKTINALLGHVLTTDEEDEYFDSSSELLRVVATAVEKANFAHNNTSEIEYAKQALEFCVDNLSEQIHEGNLVQYDN